MDRNKDEKKGCPLSGGLQSGSVKKNIIKTVCLTIIKFIFALFVLLLLPIAAIFVYLVFDDAGYCLEHGGVWDYDRKICRYDCLAWTKESGCVPLDDPDQGNKTEPVLSEAVGLGGRQVK